MYQVLAAIGGVSTLTGMGVVVYLAIKLVSVYGQLNNARDTIDGKDAALRTVTDERDGLQTQLDATRAQLKQEQDLRAVTESQRNQAQQRVRDHVVQQLQQANQTDAAAFVNDLLSQPLPGVLPPLSDASPADAAHGAGAAAGVPAAGASGAGG